MAKKDKKKKLNFFKIINIIQILLSIYLIYTLFSSKIIASWIKVIGIIVIILILLISTLLIKKARRQKKRISIFFYYLLLILTYTILIYTSSLFLSVEGTIGNITSQKYMNVSSSFFVLKKSNINSITDLKNKKIGLLTDTADYEGNIMPLKALKKESVTANIKYLPSYVELVNGLINGDFSAIVLPSDYTERFEFTNDVISEFKNFKSFYNMKDKILIRKATDNKLINENKPFNIVLIGTDSALETHHHNYDVIILLTFNPKTNDLVVTSVYRATAMYSQCIGGIDLVTHNGWKGWGPSCLKSTIEDFFKVKIDHYLMIDFQGFVDMVNALGGINVDVLKDFCEQDSARRFGSHLICLKKGEQLLNGEKALAFARHRMSYGNNGGAVRSKNHITVIKAIAKKVISTNIILKFNNLLNIIQKNMETDMSEEQIYNFYNVGLKVVKKIDYDINKINVISQGMDGYGAMYYSKAMHTTVGMNIIYEKSYYNLYNTLHTVIDYKPKAPTYYSFDLSKDPNYIPPKYLPGITEKIVDPRIMINLVGKTEAYATTFGKKYMYFELTKVYEYSDKIDKGIVISQSIPAGQSLNSKYKMSVTISKGSKD